MKAGLNTYLLKLSIFTLIIGGVAFAIHFFLLESYFVLFPAIVAYFFLSTLGIHVMLIRTTDKKSSAFVNTFMATTTLKLFMAMIIIVAYLLIDKEGAIPFTLTFAPFYLLYTSFEIMTLMKHLRSGG